MALKTISDYAELLSAAADDELLIYDVSTGTTFKITKANLIGAVLSGGFSLAVNANSVIAGQLLGEGVVDTNGFQLDVDGNSTINGSLDGEGFTLTVPATGTAALLEAQQEFTQQQTIAPTDAGDDGVIADMPSGTTNGVAFRAKFDGASRAYVQVKSDVTNFVAAGWDNGTGVGPLLMADRNNNASTPAPGSVMMRRANNTASFIWPDNAGDIRAGTAQPTNSTMGGGTVIGTQTSHIDSKNIVGDSITPEEAAQFVMNAARQVKRFTYKNGNFNGEEFSGIVLEGDTLDRYGMDADADHPAGKSLNVINAIGDLMLSVSFLINKVAEFANGTAIVIDMIENLVIRAAAIEKRLDDAGL